MKALSPAAPILGIVIACAAIGGCRSAGGPPQASAPASSPNTSPNMTLIEMTPPFRMVTLTVSEWRKLGKDETGHYRNPETKQFTMAPPMRCLNCDEFIPPPAIPPFVAALPPDERAAQVARLQQAYKCPKCGKPAYFREAPPTTPAPAPPGQAPHH